MTNGTDPWVYQAHRDRVVDGDTIDVVVDVGFRMRRTIRLRLAGVDTAEIYGVGKGSAEYADGMRHKRRVTAWFTTAEYRARESDSIPDAWPVFVHTSKTGKYGRYLARVVMRGEHPDYHPTLNDDLVEQWPDVESAE